MYFCLHAVFVSGLRTFRDISCGMCQEFGPFEGSEPRFEWQVEGFGHFLILVAGVVYHELGRCIDSLETFVL